MMTGGAGVVIWAIRKWQRGVPGRRVTQMDAAQARAAKQRRPEPPSKLTGTALSSRPAPRRPAGQCCRGRPGSGHHTSRGVRPGHPAGPLRMVRAVGRGGDDWRHGNFGRRG